MFDRSTMTRRHRPRIDWYGKLVPPLCGAFIIGFTGGALIVVMAIAK